MDEWAVQSDATMTLLEMTSPPLAGLAWTIPFLDRVSRFQLALRLSV